MDTTTDVDMDTDTVTPMDAGTNIEKAIDMNGA
jgi:hypothetical protein